MTSHLMTNAYRSWILGIDVLTRPRNMHVVLDRYRAMNAWAQQEESRFCCRGRVERLAQDNPSTSSVGLQGNKFIIWAYEVEPRRPERWWTIARYIQEGALVLRTGKQVGAAKMWTNRRCRRWSCQEKPS